MPQSTLSSDLFVQGALACKTFSPPAGCINDAAVTVNAGIQATKLVHQYAPKVDQPPGANVANATDLIHQVFAAGTGVSTIAGFEASVVTPPTSPDTVTVDLQRSTGGGAFASVLSAPITISSTTPARTPQSASLAVESLNGGDLLQVVITTNHTSGALPQGLIAQAFLRENPQ